MTLQTRLTLLSSRIVIPHIQMRTSCMELHINHCYYSRATVLLQSACWRYYNMIGFITEIIAQGGWLLVNDLTRHGDVLLIFTSTKCN